MRILNLYAGIGGNRRLWSEEHDVTAVELNPTIASVYAQLYPRDRVVVGDAHEYLLDHMNDFDFVWSSPVCKTHSRARHALVLGGKLAAQYPDMRLYEEVLALQQYASGGWVVENVIPHYNGGVPLMPAVEIGRHLYWSNFALQGWDTPMDDVRNRTVGALEKHHGIDLSPFDVPNKREMLRNCVTPEVGEYVLATYLGQRAEVRGGGLLDLLEAAQ